MALETVVVNEENQYDIFVIGGGPAGLTAALYGARSGLKTGFIEKSAPGGKLPSIKVIHNFPGVENISGSDLSTSLYKQAINANAKYIYGTVVNVIKKLAYWAIYGADGNTWFTKALIIASGTENTKLNIPGEEKYTGIGVSYCATCDGALTKGKNSIVIGNGSEAISASLYLASISNKVTLITELEKFPANIKIDTLKTKKVDILFNKTPIEIIGDSYNIASVNFRDKKSGSIENFKTTFVFIEKGYSPALSFINDLNIIKDGIVVVKKDKQTSAAGIFAAGDVSKKDNKQIITAINDGTIAATSAIKFVNETYYGKKK